MEERLQKVLAKAGVASRRRSEELIETGRIKVNGVVTTQLGVKVNPAKDKILLDNRPLPGFEQKVYILLNKPAGFVTTVRDPKGRKKVTDLVRRVKQRIYPVGRLDYETEGLLIMTNDGDLTYALTHPKHEVVKTYLARVRGMPTEEKLNQFCRGLLLEDGITAPAEVKVMGQEGSHTLLQIKIHEGRNRQVRRMCEAIGHPVEKLCRTQFGFLTLDGLEKGKYRVLRTDEVMSLYKIAGLQ